MFYAFSYTPIAEMFQKNPPGRPKINQKTNQ